MAKKSNQQPLLSPENYIRQKARNLPVYECRVNPDWQEVGTAGVLIARKHANGNLTYGIYLVDILCLGVKESYYCFNADPEDSEGMLESMSELNMQVCDYTLIHNLMYAAIEFAADYGFKPAKEYTSVTQYLLDEDTDDIELMEIECGRDGRPVYVITEEYSEMEINQTISVLERTAGKGNFDVIYEADDDFEEEEDDEDNEYDELSAEERKEMFLELSLNHMDNLQFKDYEKLDKLTNSIYQNDLCDHDRLDQLMEEWLPEFQTRISADDYTAEQLGLTEKRTLSRREVAELEEIYEKRIEGEAEVLEYIAKLRKTWGDIPYLRFMELDVMEDDEAMIEKMNRYYKQFPDYPLLKMSHTRDLLKEKTERAYEDITLASIFGDRKELTADEMYRYQLFKALYLSSELNADLLQAMYESYDILQLSSEHISQLKSVMIMLRVGLLSEHFKPRA